MKINKIISAATAAVMLVSASAFATEIEYTVSDIETGTMTVSGTVPYSSHQPWVTVSILNPGYESATGLEAVNCIKQVKVNAPANDGDEASFSVGMQLNNPTEATYKIRVNYYGAEELLEKDMSYYSSGALGDLCADIKTAKTNKDADELETLLGGNDVLSFLGVRTAIVGTVALEDICEMLAGNDKISMDSTAEGVRRAYEEAASLIILASKDSEEYIAALRGANGESAADVLKGSYESKVAYEVFADAEDSIAEEIIDNLKEKSYKNLADFNESFEFEVLNCTIKGADSYLDVRGVMSEYEDVFETSWTSEYNALSNSKKIKAENALLKKVKSSKMSSIEDIAEAFLDCIEDADKEPSKGSGGTGGGGGGGSASIKVEQPLVQEIKEESAVKTDLPFADLDTVPWAVESIKYLADKGVISGKSKLVFEPDSNVKREEFIKMVVLAFGIENEAATDCSFEDVLSTDWFRPYVSLGVECGIVKGVNEYFFGSGMNITRQDIAVMLCRAAEYKGITLSGSPKAFADGETVSDYARESVDKISAAGAAGGDENGNFMPHAFATRAEAAKMIYSLVNPNK